MGRQACGTVDISELTMAILEQLLKCLIARMNWQTHNRIVSGALSRSEVRTNATCCFVGNLFLKRKQLLKHRFCPVILAHHVEQIDEELVNIHLNI